MGKWFCFWILFMASLSSWAQDSIRADGYTAFYYPNGVKSSEGYLVNGQPDGWWKSYNQDGILISEGNRKNFLLDSTWIFYNSAGNKILEVNYQEGKKSGPRIQYFDEEFIVENWRNDSIVDGITVYYSDSSMKKYTPYENGRAHGMEKEFNKDGLVTAVTVFYRGAMTRREFINRTDHFGLKQGNWKFFWDNGNLQMEGTYQNDKRHGFFKYYDENGNFLSVEKYIRDILQEDAPETKVLEKKITYHPNGQPAITATYYKGEPEGIRREFDSTGVVIRGYIFENGVVRFEGITDLEGRRQGLWKEYYPTGELRSEGRYVNSMPVGEWKFFFPDHTIEMQGSYNRQGKKVGEWIWYYTDGSLLRVENYEAGELEGPFLEYDEEGNEITKGQYLADAEEGEWVYRHGNMLEKGSYYDGMRQGIWKLWYGNGTLASETEYDQDLPNGKFTQYWENGRVKTTGKYITGEPAGIWYKYDEDGTLFLTTVFRDGLEYMWNSYKIKE